MDGRAGDGRPYLGGQEGAVTGVKREQRAARRAALAQGPDVAPYIASCGRFGSGQSMWKNLPRGWSTRS